jgi:hypothetical protein
MSFQAPITIRKALENIENKRYFMPAIQREFVWETAQIEQLFDSILRGYPIGSLLFWLVSPQNSKEYEFYEFIRDYHELKHSHNQKAEFIDQREVTAILDGQQRLTALNVGLRGSYASKVKWKRALNPDAYPTRYLYLDLLKPREDDENDTYAFSFLTKQEAGAADSKRWFPASKILEFKGPMEVNTYLASLELANNQCASAALFGFYQRVTESATINFYQEDDQNLDKVLRIFIRANRGGTTGILGPPAVDRDRTVGVDECPRRDRRPRRAIERCRPPVCVCQGFGHEGVPGPDGRHFRYPVQGHELQSFQHQENREKLGKYQERTKAGRGTAY